MCASGSLRLSAVVALVTCFLADIVGAHREHKVHNIVLYPEKHSWCKTTPIKQVVAYPGCTSVEMDNNVCVGACFSYSIPRTSPSAPGELIQPYCDSCQPSTVQWRHVSLVCEGEEAMIERVQLIENCSCSTCAGASGTEPALAADDTSEPRRPSLLDVPELMNLMMETHNTRRLNETAVPPTPLPEPLLALLKQFSLDEPDRKPDPNALKELLSHVQGVDDRVNHVTLAELIRQVENSEHMVVDVAQLKRTLAKLIHEHRGHEEKHGHHGPHDHRELDELHEHRKVEEHHVQHEPIELHNRHHPHGHHTHPHSHPHPHHKGPGIGPALGETHLFNERGEGPSGPVPKGLGLGLGLGLDGLDPTLDVSSHHLKPALAGSHVSYHENIVLPPHRDDHSDDDDEEF